MAAEQDQLLSDLTQSEYKYGFTTDVETDTIKKGLSEEVVRIISAKKNEPEWMLEFRLKAYRHWLTMKMPTWPHLKIPEITKILFFMRHQSKKLILMEIRKLTLN